MNLPDVECCDMLHSDIYRFIGLNQQIRHDNNGRSSVFFSGNRTSQCLVVLCRQCLSSMESGHSCHRDECLEYWGYLYMRYPFICDIQVV